MIRRPPRSTRTATLFPYTTLFRSGPARGSDGEGASLRRLCPRDACGGRGAWRHRLYVGIWAGLLVPSCRLRPRLARQPGRTSRASRGAGGLVGGERGRQPATSSEERRAGKERVSTGRSRWSPYHLKNKKLKHK